MLFDQLLDVPPGRISGGGHRVEDERVVEHILDEGNQPVGAVRVEKVVAAARGRSAHDTHGQDGLLVRFLMALACAQARVRTDSPSGTAVSRISQQTMEEIVQI